MLESYISRDTQHSSHVSQVFINIYRKSRENLKPKSSNFCNWELGPALNLVFQLEKWSFQWRWEILFCWGFFSVQMQEVRWDPQILHVLTPCWLDVSPELWTILMRLSILCQKLIESPGEFSQSMHYSFKRIYKWSKMYIQIS